MPIITKNQLISLQKKYKTDALIGKQFGITRQAVHQLRQKFMIESTIIKNIDRNKKILELSRIGQKRIWIAEKFNISISQTYRIISNGKRRMYT